MRDVGLIIDIFGNQGSASVVVANNIFKNTQYYYKDSLTSNPPNHCEGILNPPLQAQYPVYETTGINYMQAQHLINFRNSINSSLILIGNSF